MEELELEQEDKILSDGFQVNIDEFKRMSDFFKSFINNFNNISIFDDTKAKKKKDNTPLIYESILLSGLTGIYDTFQLCINNIKKIMNKIENGIIKPLDEFRAEQLKIYKKDLNKIKEINKTYKLQKYLLEKAKYNYYKASFFVAKNKKNK